MAKFCGGPKLDNSFKIIKGVICDSSATDVDVTKAVSACGQLWDGSLFTATMVDGHKIITLHNSEGEDIGTPIFVRGPKCGVGLDGRFFKVDEGKISLQDGFVLTVVTDPEAASVTVVDVDGETIDPIEENGKVFLLSGIGNQYGVNVEYDGYTGKHLTITNDKDQTLTVELEEMPQS